MNKLLSNLDITIAQHEILFTLNLNEGITHKELSKKLFVVKSNISNLIKKLEHRGLVCVTPCLKDQRVKRLGITKEGEQLLKKSTEVRRIVVKTMMQDVSSEDLEATNRLMLSALSSLDKLA